MTDMRVEKVAELLVQYSTEVKPGDKVAIRGGVLAEPLIKAVYQKVLEAGGLPFVMPEFSWTDELLYKYGNDEQIVYLPKPQELVFDTFDVMISLGGPVNTKHLSGVDSRKQVQRSQAFSDLFKKFLGRAARKEVRWTLTVHPTQALAQDAERSLDDYADFVYKATLPDINDPVGYWKRFSAKQQKAIDWLNGKKKVHIVAPDTDLYLSIEDRIFVNCDCHENVPDGEIFTGPVEDSIEGHVAFSFPAIYGGREVEGIRLWFEKGRVVKASATKNEEYLLRMLDTDAGARYVGEFAIGTNEGITEFTREILFDEKIGGSFHMALGAGYPETGSHNESAIHWDMICDLRQGGEISVDGELFYKNGAFSIDLS
jgi:aminopeptidase